jgi:hypothetical protein
MLGSKIVNKLLDNENDENNEKSIEDYKRRKFIHQYDLFFDKMKKLLIKKMIKTHGRIYNLNEVWNIKKEKRYMPR